MKLEVLNNYAGFFAVIQTIVSAILAIITIRLAYIANKKSDIAIKVSKELAELPYKKELFMNSWLDIRDEKYVLHLRIVNVGNSAVQIKEIHITSGNESDIKYVEVDNDFVAIPYSGQIELVHKWRFDKYLVSHKEIICTFVLQNCSVHKHYENDIKITVVDTELKEYYHIIPWAVG